jgi:hypothetical protein
MQVRKGQTMSVDEMTPDEFQLKRIAAQRRPNGTASAPSQPAEPASGTKTSR